MSPFVFIGKEIERRAQEGEEVSVLENAGQLRYHRHQTTNTQPCSPQLLKKLKRFSLRQLQQSGLSRDTIIQARRGDRVHPATRQKLARLVEKVERKSF